jgi:hypothetical protein
VDDVFSVVPEQDNFAMVHTQQQFWEALSHGQCGAGYWEGIMSGEGAQ